MKSGAIISLSKNHLLLGLGKHTKHSSQPDNPNNTAFYFPDFFLKDPLPWRNYEEVIEITPKDLSHLLEKDQTQKPSIQWHPPSKTAFQHTFLDLQSRFSSGEFSKAVPYLIEQGITKTEFTNNHFFYSLLNVLKYAEKHPVHLYGFWDEYSGMLGATPEILFSQKQNFLFTMACAGTSDLENAQHLLTNKKDLMEHQIVLDSIKQSLQENGTVRVLPTKVVPLRRLAHLVTEMELCLNVPFSFQAIVENLHPTPALGTFPKKNEWLQSYNSAFPRQRFGAPVGVVHKNDSRCLVAIRNMQWNKNLIQIGAGCGMIAASIFEKEWNEIKIKIQEIKDLLGL